MSDAQLAERLDRIWQDYSQAEPEAWPLKLKASFRGPIRHPITYPFLSWLGARTRLSLIFGLSFGFSVQGLLSKRFRALTRMHLALCEARDIIEEMKRRVGSAALATGQNWE